MDIGLFQHGYLIRHLFLRVQIQVVMDMNQIVLNCNISNQLIIIHRYFNQLLCG